MLPHSAFRPGSSTGSWRAASYRRFTFQIASSYRETDSRGGSNPTRRKKTTWGRQIDIAIHCPPLVIVGLLQGSRSIVCESACKHIKEEASIYLAQGILGHMESHRPVVRRFCHLFGICHDPRGAWGERCVALGRRCGHWRPFPLVSASPTCSPSLPLVEAEPPVSVDRITSATRREWQERHAGPITQNSPGDTYSSV